MKKLELRNGDDEADIQIDRGQLLITNQSRASRFDSTLKRELYNDGPLRSLDSSEIRQELKSFRKNAADFIGVGDKQLSVNDYASDNDKKLKSEVKFLDQSGKIKNISSLKNNEGELSKRKIVKALNSNNSENQQYKFEQKSLKVMKKSGSVSAGNKQVLAVQNKQTKESRLLSTITSIMETDPNIAIENKLFELKAIKKRYAITNQNDATSAINTSKHSCVVIKETKLMSQGDSSKSIIKISSQAQNNVLMDQKKLQTSMDKFRQHQKHQRYSTQFNVNAYAEPEKERPSTQGDSGSQMKRIQSGCHRRTLTAKNRTIFGNQEARGNISVTSIEGYDSTNIQTLNNTYFPLENISDNYSIAKKNLHMSTSQTAIDKGVRNSISQAADISNPSFRNSIQSSSQLFKKRQSMDNYKQNRSNSPETIYNNMYQNMPRAQSRGESSGSLIQLKKRFSVSKIKRENSNKPGEGQVLIRPQSVMQPSKTEKKMQPSNRPQSQVFTSGYRKISQKDEMAQKYDRNGAVKSNLLEIIPIKESLKPNGQDQDSKMIMKSRMSFISHKNIKIESFHGIHVEEMNISDKERTARKSIQVSMLMSSDEKKKESSEEKHELATTRKINKINKKFQMKKQAEKVIVVGAKNLKKAQSKQLDRKNSNNEVKLKLNNLAQLLKKKDSDGESNSGEDFIKKALQASFLKTLKIAQVKTDLQKKKKEESKKTDEVIKSEKIVQKVNASVYDFQDNIFQQIFLNVSKENHIEIVQKKGCQAALSKASNLQTREALEQIESAQIAADNDKIYDIDENLDFYTKQIKRKQQKKILSTDATKTMNMLSKEFKMVNYQASQTVSRSNQKHIMLFSDSQAQHSVQEIMSSKLNAIEKSIMPSYSNVVKIDVVQGNIPVLCKIYVGNRQSPSIRFFLRECPEEKQSDQPNSTGGTSPNAKSKIVSKKNSKAKNSAQNSPEKKKEKSVAATPQEPKVTFITQIVSKPDTTKGKKDQGKENCLADNKGKIPKRKRIKGETGNLSDLYTYISNNNKFPNANDYDKSYFNESSFTYHTDPAMLDPLKKPVIDLTKDVYKKNIKDDPLDIKNKDKFALEKKQEQLDGIIKLPVVKNSDDYVYISFMSQYGLKISLKAVILGTFKPEVMMTDQLMPNDNDKFQRMIYRPEPQMKLVTKNFELQQYIEDTPWISNEERDQFIEKEVLDQLNDFCQYETEKEQAQRNWSHIQFPEQNQQTQALYTPLYLMQQSLQNKKMDHLKGIMARQKKREDLKTFIKSKQVQNDRWKDYAKQRELAVEEYVQLVKKCRLLNRFIVFMEIFKIFKKQFVNHHQLISYRQYKFKVRYVSMKLSYLRRQVFIKQKFSGMDYFDRERQRIRFCFTICIGQIKLQNTLRQQSIWQTCKTIFYAFLWEQGESYRLKFQILRYANTEIIEKKVKLHLSMGDMMDILTFASIQKERLFLKIHFDSKKKPNSEIKGFISKIRKIDDDLLLIECRKLRQLMQKKKLFQKYEHKIDQLFQRVKLLKCLNNPENIKDELVMFHLTKMLKRTGYKPQQINEIKLHPRALNRKMLYEIHIKRWLTIKMNKLRQVIIDMEANILSSTEIINQDKLNELSLSWQKYRLENPNMLDQRTDNEKSSGKKQLSDKLFTQRDEKVTYKKYELFLKGLSPYFTSGTNSVQQEGKRRLKSPSISKQNKKIQNEEKRTTIFKNNINQKLRLSILNSAQKANNQQHPSEESDDNDSLYDLDQIPEIVNPRSFTVEDYKDKSINFIPTKEMMQKVIFKCMENM